MRLLLALLIAAAPVSALAKDRPDTTASSPEAVAQVTPDPTIIGTPPALPPVDFQVVRLGDSNLSCEALMTEINTLSAQASAGINFDYSAMMPKGSMMGGAGMSGIGMLAGLDPTGLSSMFAGQAMAAKARADADKQMKQVEDQMAGMQQKMALAQQQQQRVQHLQSLFQEKKC
mgnify:CR=1 FL=1